MDGGALNGRRGLDHRVPFLARLESVDRSALLTLGRQLDYTARMALILQHEPSSHVLFLVHGWTKVTASAANGYEALLALRGPGDIVGESAALTGRPRSATVTALEPGRSVAVEHERFKDFLSRSPAVSFALLGLTADRTRAADRRRLEFASMSVRERFAVLLLDLARTHGRRTEEGIELAVPLSKQELAGSVGASREMVQRLLRELRDKEAVVTGRRALLIRRPDVLRRIAAAGPAFSARTSASASNWPARRGSRPTSTPSGGPCHSRRPGSSTSGSPSCCCARCGSVIPPPGPR